jgi:hypothetical protein
MEDSTQGIRRNCDNLEEELGKARKGFSLLLRKAKATLAALDIELVDKAAERAFPLELPQASVERVAHEQIGDSTTPMPSATA